MTTSGAPVRIQLMSDLHLEEHVDGGNAFIRQLDPQDVDVLVVAGNAGDKDDKDDKDAGALPLLTHAPLVTSMVLSPSRMEKRSRTPSSWPLIWTSRWRRSLSRMRSRSDNPPSPSPSIEVPSSKHCSGT